MIVTSNENGIGWKSVHTGKISRSGQILWYIAHLSYEIQAEGERYTDEWLASYASYLWDKLAY